jgi:drug/metabolite transporter (DMT)-like permease
MDYLILAGAVVCASTSSIFGGFFNRSLSGKRGTSAFYNFFQLLTVFVGWTLLLIIDFEFNVAVIPYAVAFGIAYCVSTFGAINALRTGPVLLTSLITQFSLIATTIWGFFFWGSKVSLLVVIGLVLVAVALFFCIYTKGDSENRVSLKWILWVLVCFVGNSAASIVARTQQIDFGGRFKGQFIALATVITLVISIFMYAKSEKRHSAEMLKKSGYLPVASGVLNALYSVLILVLSTSRVVPVNLLYPTAGVGSIALVSLFAQFVLKEKMTNLQWTGLVIGAVAIALLSI